MPVRDGRRPRGVTTRPFPSSRPDIGQVSGAAVLQNAMYRRAFACSQRAERTEKQLVGDAIDWIGG